MNSALSPREIQARLRAGASVPEVAAEAGVEVDRIEGFALPVMAERAHMTRTALGASVRRRGDASGHRRLGEIVRERLQTRSLDADTVEWDSWRQNDLKWRLVGLLDDQAASRAAEFVFDPKGRFSVADNADARWMIGESLPGPQTDPDNENTIDFNDELALVRAISDGPYSGSGASGRPGDDVPPHYSQYEGAAHTSELDELYDMLSGVSEDSVRIYLGLDDAEESEGVKDSADEDTESMDQEELATAPTTENSTSAESAPQASENASHMEEPETTLADKLSEHPELEEQSSAELEADDGVVDDAQEGAPPAASTDEGTDEEVSVEPVTADSGTSGVPAASDVEFGEAGKPNLGASEDGAPYSPLPAEQDPLVPDVAPAAPKRKPAKKRASIPSWDEIMFGGPSQG